MKTTVKTPWSKKTGVAVIAGVLAAAALVGCERRDEQVSQTPGQKLDEAIADSREAGREASARMEERVDQAQASAEQNAQEAKVAIAERTDQAKAAVERGTEKTAQAFDDAKLTAEVKSALIKDETVQATAINVDTKNGAVTLTGTVPSQTARERAVSLARKVDGVASVRNDLTVTPPDTRTSSSSSKD
ncbi:MAG: BON domain-containing protein [Aquabacterium sp.]|nr:BON domain-containing protein [Aquabacterium sp.]